MVAVEKKTGKAYQVVKYSLRVNERGSDTDFGKESMSIYLPEQRSNVSVEPRDYIIHNDWNSLPGLKCQDCGTVGPDVTETTCPYAEEICGERVDIIVCGKCYRERCMDI